MGIVAGNFFPVIRSSGERTTDLARLLLEKVFAPETIVTINEAPFENALRKGFALAMDCGKEWVFFLDADVLPSPERLRKVLDFCMSADEGVFFVLPTILDKFFGMPRDGTHFYRVKHIEKLYEGIPADSTTPKPESTAIQYVRDKYSLALARCNEVYAVHDYEQYYRDIFRTAFVHGGKHSAFSWILSNYWKSMSGADADFVVALLGIYSKRAVPGIAKIDINAFPKDISNILEPVIGISEKSTITDSTGMAEKIEQIISGWKPTAYSRVLDFRRDWWRRPRLPLMFNSVVDAIKNKDLLKELSLHFNAELTKFIK